jgi:DNA-directed RNA polymerase specialized sigma24 family protein
MEIKEADQLFIFNIRAYNKTLDEVYFNKAYNDLFDISVDIAYGLLNASSNPHHNFPEAEDVAQEFWIRVMNNKIDPFSLYDDVKQQAINDMNKAMMQKRGGDMSRIDLSPLDIDDAFGYHEQTPDSMIQSKEDMVLLDKLLWALPIMQRNAAFLGIVRMKNGEEIGTQLGINPDYAARIVKFAKHKFKYILRR